MYMKAFQDRKMCVERILASIHIYKNDKKKGKKLFFQQKYKSKV